MIAVDWSFTKDLTTFDGKKLRVENKLALLKRVKSSKDGAGEESISIVKFKGLVYSPAVVLEQGCPLSLIYSLVRAGVNVYTISNRATQDYRVKHEIEKTDENDAKIIYELASEGANLQQVSLDDKGLQMHDLYHQYCRYQKARVAMQNMRKSHMRAFGDGESNKALQSTPQIHPSPDLSPYDIAIDTLHAREKSLLKTLEEGFTKQPLIGGGESNRDIKSTRQFQPPPIKGLGRRIWLGLMVAANPQNFKCLSAYLRFCGLTQDVIKSHKYNRHARMLYHMLAEEVMKKRDHEFRPIYDNCKKKHRRETPRLYKGTYSQCQPKQSSNFPG